MKHSVADIAKLIGGEVVGDQNVVITGACGIKEAQEGDITFVANARYHSLVEQTNASAIITGRDFPAGRKTIVRTDNPSLAFSRLIAQMLPSNLAHPVGIHETAQIGKKVCLGQAVAIGAYVVIGDNAVIGDRTVLYPGSFIGNDTTIGKDCLIYPHVSIRERIAIGDRVIIHSGAVVGSDGFGFVNVDGRHHKIPQVGIVEIQDDVEIGANVTIDRARFDKTVIGKGTKIDNLVQIAHNVVLGENVLVVAQAGISGSTRIGDTAIIAGQAGLVGHITIGEGAVVAAQAGVTKSVAAKTMVSGYPAKPHAEAKRINACIQNLPEAYKTIADLKKRIRELEERLSKG